MGRIFICYRRDDSMHATQRMHGFLEHRFKGGSLSILMVSSQERIFESVSVARSAIVILLSQ